jgi:hypothetical protein
MAVVKKILYSTLEQEYERQAICVGAADVAKQWDKLGQAGEAALLYERELRVARVACFPKGIRLRSVIGKQGGNFGSVKKPEISAWNYFSVIFSSSIFQKVDPKAENLMGLTRSRTA